MKRTPSTSARAERLRNDSGVNLVDKTQDLIAVGEAASQDSRPAGGRWQSHLHGDGASGSSLRSELGRLQGRMVNRQPDLVRSRRDDERSPRPATGEAERRWAIHERILLIPLLARPALPGNRQQPKLFVTASRLQEAAKQRLDAQNSLHEQGGSSIDRYLDASTDSHERGPAGRLSKSVQRRHRGTRRSQGPLRARQHSSFGLERSGNPASRRAR